MKITHPESRHIKYMKYEVFQNMTSYRHMQLMRSILENFNHNQKMSRLLIQRWLQTFISLVIKYASTK